MQARMWNDGYNGPGNGSLRVTLLRATIPVLAMALAICPACAQRADSLIPRLERLAQNGSAEALYHLGMSYQTGSGVPLDHGKALAYFRRAAAAGDPLAAYKLGCFYAGQDGVLPVDEAQALANKLVAARAGYALAQNDVAALLAARGDVAAAESWLGRAAAQGYPESLFGYASLHNGKNGLARNGAVVVAYFSLFLATRDAGLEQRAWLDKQRAGLTAEERARADQIVAEYRPTPTPLTLKALSGQRAARELVSHSGPD